SKDGAVYCPVCGGLREPGEGCSECGWQPSADPQKPDTILGVALVKYAAKRRGTDEQRGKTPRRGVGVAHAEGHKEGWAMHRYRVVYGDWPPREIVRAARVVTRGGEAA